MVEANRWIATNKAGTVEIGRKLLKDEDPEVLAKAYDIADPRLWGVNADISEAAYKFTVEFLMRVGWMTEPVPYDKFYDRRFLDRVLTELGRM